MTQDNTCAAKGTRAASNQNGPTVMLNSFTVAAPVADYPGIIWKGSPNFWVGRNNESVRAICFHGTGSPVGDVSRLSPTLNDVDVTFADYNRQASTHFAISRTGETHQYVKTANTAWGNGIVTTYDTSVVWLDNCIKRGDNPNYQTISIETHNIGDNSASLSELQYQSLLALVTRLLKDFPSIVPARGDGLIGHYQIDGVGRARCPGVNFPWQRLLTDLKGVQPTMPQPQQPTNSQFFKETGLTVNDPFLSYFNQHGGVAIFGLPITAEEPSVKYRLDYVGSVQWFERARLEWHDKEKMVMLGRVGAELLQVKK